MHRKDVSPFHSLSHSSYFQVWKSQLFLPEFCKFSFYWDRYSRFKPFEIYQLNLEPCSLIESVFSTDWYSSVSRLLNIQPYIHTYELYFIWPTNGQTYTEHYTITNQQNLPNISSANLLFQSWNIFPVQNMFFLVQFHPLCSDQPIHN